MSKYRKKELFGSNRVQGTVEQGSIVREEPKLSHPKWNSIKKRSQRENSGNHAGIKYAGNNHAGNIRQVTNLAEQWFREYSFQISTDMRVLSFRELYCNTRNNRTMNNLTVDEIFSRVVDETQPNRASDSQCRTVVQSNSEPGNLKSVYVSTIPQQLGTIVFCVHIQ